MISKVIQALLFRCYRLELGDLYSAASFVSQLNGSIVELFNVSHFLVLFLYQAKYVTFLTLNFRWNNFNQWLQAERIFFGKFKVAMSQGIEELNFEFHKLRAGPKTSNENLSMMETFVYVECVIHLFGCVHLRSELDSI